MSKKIRVDVSEKLVKKAKKHAIESKKLKGFVSYSTAIEYTIEEVLNDK